MSKEYIVVSAKVKEDADSGEVGLVPSIYAKWFDRNYNPTVSLGHDLIAHRPYENGFLHEEVRALGVEAYISNYGLRYPRMSNYEATVAIDLAFSFSSAYNFDAFLPDIPAKKIPNLRSEETLDNFIDYVLQEEFQKALEDELNYDDESDYALITDWHLTNQDSIKAWFVSGYLHAQNIRYANVEAFKVFAMRQKLNDMGKFLTTKTLEMYEGCKFKIHYSIAEEHAFVTVSTGGVEINSWECK